MASIDFAIRPLPRQQAARLRDAGGAVYVADRSPGYPCRQCLRDADVGEELILVSHDPFELDGPYRSRSPIFVHRHDCGDPDLEVVPEQLVVRDLSVRSFDDREMMLDAAVVAGSDLSDTVSLLFADPRATTIHVHNAQRGCWAAGIERLES